VVIREARVPSPRRFKTEESEAFVDGDAWFEKNSPGGIDIELHQRYHDAAKGLRFLFEGPKSISKHVQRDIKSAFTLVGTKVYTEDGEIEGELNAPPTRP
jgi:hypothetical protein